jgi:hypothetical protein
MNERTRRPLHSLSVLARPPPRFRLPRPLQSRSPRTLEVSGSFNRALAPPKQPSSDSETEIEVCLPPLPASAPAPSARAGFCGSCWFKGSRPRCRAHIMWRGARCGRAHGNPQIQPNARAPHAFTHIYACCARPFAFCSFVAQIRHEPAYDQEVQGAATAAEEDGRRKRALPRVAGRLGHLPGPLAVGSGAGHGVAQHLRDHRGRLRGREAGAFFPHRESFSQTHGLLAARVGPCLTLVCALPPPSRVRRTPPWPLPACPRATSCHPCSRKPSKRRLGRGSGRRLFRRFGRRPAFPTAATRCALLPLNYFGVVWVQGTQLLAPGALANEAKCACGNPNLF